MSNRGRERKTEYVSSSEILLPKGVKSMKIEEDEESGEFYLSHARTFESIQKLIIYYRRHDLTENFNYASLRNVTLKMPYKDI